MTDERIARGLMLQARRRRLTNTESRWLSAYRNSQAPGCSPRRKGSSQVFVWLFLCIFIGSGLVYTLLTLSPEAWLEVSYWTKLLNG